MLASSQQGLVSEKKKKLIKIDPKVHQELNEVGLRGESFSDIIHRLVNFYKEHRNSTGQKE
jgi:predicted CopG family antitoxin